MQDNLSRKIIKDWYNQRYAAGTTVIFRPLEAYSDILRYLRVRPPGKLLDVACGRGLLLSLVSKIGLETYGIDISEEAVRLAQDNSPDSKVLVGEAEDLRFEDDTFDYITCLGSLEHFLDISKGLQEMRRVARKDAAFCIVVPNVNFLLWRLRGKVGTEQQDINERLFTLKEWKNIFINNGFRITGIYKDKWFKKYRCLDIKRFFAYLAWFLIPINYCYQFVFLLKEDEAVPFGSVLKIRRAALYITRKYPPSIGGMQKMNYSLACALSKRITLDKIVWGYSQIFLPIFICIAGIQIVYFLFILRRNYDFILLGDVLLSPLGILIRRFRSTFVVCIAHGLDVTFKGTLYQSLVISALKKSDMVVCVSQNTRQECLLRGIQPSRVKVIPNGVNMPLGVNDRLNAYAKLKESFPQIPDNSMILLSVGRLVRRKGIEGFIKNTFSSLKKEYSNLCYLIIGMGNRRHQIEQVIKENNLADRIFLLGQVNNEILECAYLASDIFIMPNIKVEGDVEGFGIVVLEASSYGLPVVASDLEGLKDIIIEGRNGLLVPPQAYTAFKDKIIKLLKDESLRLDLSIKAKELASNFSWEEISDRYLLSLEQGLSERRIGL
jgi:glycosyltransferase involved in cell wall biosynthesis/SAM-dependent methyltransferase